MSHIETRQATPADQEFCRDIYFESQRWAIEQSFGWDEAREYEKFRRMYKPVETQIIVAGGRPVGWLQLEDKGGSLDVAGIYITDSYQKHGVGLTVIRGVLNRARAENKSVLFSSSRIKRSKKLFERLGFYITHEHDHSFEIRYGAEG